MAQEHDRQTISTNTPSERRVGYSRAVRIGNTIYVSGTTSQNEEGEVQGSSVGEQAEYIISKIQDVLVSVDASIADTALVRAYMADMDSLPQFDETFNKHFRDIKPACTVVGVTSLVDPRFLIEIEIIAQRQSTKE